MSLRIVTMLALHVSTCELLISTVSSAVTTTSSQAATTDTSSNGNCERVCSSLPPVLPNIAIYFRQTIDIIKTSQENAYMFRHLLPAANNGTTTSSNFTWSSLTSDVKCFALMNSTQQANDSTLKPRAAGATSDDSADIVRPDIITIVGICVVVGLPIVSLIGTCAVKKCRNTPSSIDGSDVNQQPLTEVDDDENSANLTERIDVCEQKIKATYGSCNSHSATSAPPDGNQLNPVILSITGDIPDDFYDVMDRNEGSRSSVTETPDIVMSSKM